MSAFFVAPPQGICRADTSRRRALRPSHILNSKVMKIYNLHSVILYQIIL